MSNSKEANAVMVFATNIQGAYLGNFIDNHPTVYDIYRSAQNHVKDIYGVETEIWNDKDSKKSREDTFEKMEASLNAEIKRLREALDGIKSGAEFYEKSSGNKGTAIYGLGLVVERCNLALKDPRNDKGTEAN